MDANRLVLPLPKGLTPADAAAINGAEAPGAVADVTFLKPPKNPPSNTSNFRPGLGCSAAGKGRGSEASTCSAFGLPDICLFHSSKSSCVRTVNPSSWSFFTTGSSIHSGSLSW